MPPVKDYLVDFYSSYGGVELEYLEEASYVLCECNACGLIFQEYIPNDDLMKRLYEHWIDSEKIPGQRMRDKYDLEYHSKNAQEIMQIIYFFKKMPSSLDFFDFGMGWGKWALMVKAFGCNSYGSELSTERVKFAESNGIHIIEWSEIPQQNFDFINTEQVFEHISEPLNTLRHLKQALKADGILKISVPAAIDIKRRLKIMDWRAPKGSKNSLNPVAPLEHINFFRRMSLTAMAKEAGMEEMFIPAHVQLRYTTDWGSLRKIGRNILRPIRRNLMRRSNYVFLRNTQ